MFMLLHCLVLTPLCLYLCYRYLKWSVDCTPDGITFGGWHEVTPTSIVLVFIFCLIPTVNVLGTPILMAVCVENRKVKPQAFGWLSSFKTKGE